MKIGMRNIKTALSVSLCAVIFQIFNMGSPFYAAIAAIISMQSSVADTFKTGKNRMLGTFLGALVGLCFALLGPSNPILIGIGIIIIIYVSNRLKWNKSITIAGVVFIAIMVNLNGKSPWSYSFNRIIDTMIGITVAVLINYFISPPINPKQLSEHSRELTALFFDELKLLLCHGGEMNVKKLNDQISTLEKEYKDYRKEFKVRRKDSLEISHIQKVTEILGSTLEHLRMAAKIQGRQPLTKDNWEKADRLLDCSLVPSAESCDETAIVYNYHIGKALDYMEEIQKL